METQVANMRWLSRFVLCHRRSAVGALVTGFVAGMTSALEPHVIGQIIDHVAQQGPFEELVNLILIMLGLAVITIVAFFGQRHYSGEIAYAVNFDVRRVLFDNLLTLENRFFQQYATGDLISRMHSDVEMIWRLLALGFTRFGSALFTVIITFGVLGSISLPLTLIVFFVLTISTALQMRAGLILAPVFEKVQAQGGALSALVQDTFSGIQTIKTTGSEASIARKYNHENTEYRRRWLFFKRRNEPIGMLPNMISELTAAVVVLFGGVMTLQGMLSIGDFAKFLLYLSMISTVLLQLGTIYQRYQQTRGALSRLTPFLKDAEIRNLPDARPLKTPHGDISFQNVSVIMEGKRRLDNISLDIPAGATVAFVGPTGCGKTLLVSLLARVLDPDTGRVLVDGIDIRQYDLDDLRAAISYVPQSTYLFSLPLHQNVRMGKGDIEEDELNSAIYISRVSNDLPQLPQGLETMVGERGVMLSGGQKQRVAIARAIIRDPSILVLDDALSSVDTHTAADILKDLRGVLRTRTSLIIAHRVGTVKDADLIVVMDDGRIVEQGSHTDLMHRDGAYARMVEREMKEEVVAHGK
jgi:ATP-binding cassette, subfamily B, multidrug efflux pump